MCNIGNLAVAILFAGSPALSPALAAADVSDSEEVSKLLSQAKTQAFQVKGDAWTMESFTRMTVSPETQAAAIDGVRDRVNELSRLVAKLDQSKDMASPWQRTAMDRINRR